MHEIFMHLLKETILLKYILSVYILVEKRTHNPACAILY